MFFARQTGFQGRRKRSTTGTQLSPARQAMLVASLLQDVRKAQRSRRRKLVLLTAGTTLLFAMTLLTALWFLQPDWTPNTWAGLVGLPMAWAGLFVTWFQSRVDP